MMNQNNKNNTSLHLLHVRHFAEHFTRFYVLCSSGKTQGIYYSHCADEEPEAQSQSGLPTQYPVLFLTTTEAFSSCSG